MIETHIHYTMKCDTCGVQFRDEEVGCYPDTDCLTGSALASGWEYEPATKKMYCFDCCCKKANEEAGDGR